MFNLSKDFNFCYSHRVYSQNVNEKYAESAECPCHRLHGHQGSVSIHMQTEELDHRGFVLDFKELGFVGKFLDARIDHRFVLSTMDPNFELITGKSLDELTLVDITVLDGVVAGKMINLDGLSAQDQMHLQSFFIVDFNPTSEELSKWIFNLVQDVIDKSPFECNVQKVVWSETPKTQATYLGDSE